MIDLCIQSLVDAGVITEQLLTECSVQKGETTIEALLRTGLLSEIEYLENIAKASGIPSHDIYICPPVFSLLNYNRTDDPLRPYCPLEVLQEYFFVPLWREQLQENKNLVVGLADPFDISVVYELQNLLHCDIVPRVVSPRAARLALHILSSLYLGDDLEQLEKKFKSNTWSHTGDKLANSLFEGMSTKPDAYSAMPTADHLRDTLEEIFVDNENSLLHLYNEDRDLFEDEYSWKHLASCCKGLGVDNWRGMANDECPFALLIDAILSWGMKKRVHHICLETTSKDFLRLRAKMDKQWFIAEDIQIPRCFFDKIVSQIKEFANLDIAESHIPQSGIFERKIGGKTLTLKIHLLLTSDDQDISIRYLPGNERLLYSQIGLDPAIGCKLQKITAGVPGLILLTGPANSGKKTTLYALIKKFFPAPKKIIAVGHDIFNDSDITVVPVCEEFDVNIAKILDFTTKYSPDVLVLTEPFVPVEQPEILKKCLQAIYEGIFVFAYLPFSTPVEIVLQLHRLLGAHFSAISSLRMILNQRLLRLLCPKCKLPESDNSLFYRPVGCAKCGGSGFYHYKAIFHSFTIDEEIVQVAHQNNNIDLRKVLAKSSTNLYDTAIKLAQQGSVTLDEAIFQTQESM